MGGRGIRECAADVCDMADCCEISTSAGNFGCGVDGMMIERSDAVPTTAAVAKKKFWTPLRRTRADRRWLRDPMPHSMRR